MRNLLTAYVFIISFINVNAQTTYSFHSDTIFINNKIKENNNKKLGYILKKVHKNTKIEYMKSTYEIFVTDTVKYGIDFIKKDLKGFDILRYPKVVKTLETYTNDPYTNGNIVGSTNAFHLNALNIRKAWDITQGNPNVIVGVVDTDFDPTHEDLIGQYTSTTQIFPGDNHGVKTSGMIVAISNNGKGIAGIANKCKVDGQVYFNPGYIKGAVDRCFNNGAKIISISISWSGLTPTEMQNYIDQGVVFVLAQYYNSHSEVSNLPGVFIVSNVNSDGWGTFSSLANIYGAVNEGATSNKLTSTIRSNTNCDLCCYPTGYCYAGGNSIATAQISGIVALMRSVNPCLTPAEISDILISTSKYFKAGLNENNYELKKGLADAYAAVQEALNRAKDFFPLIHQNKVLYSHNSFAWSFYKIGSNVSPNFGYGGVSVAPTNSVTLTAREVEIKNDFEVPLGAEFNVIIDPNLYMECDNGN
jgi:subtilisin family serine protease